MLSFSRPGEKVRLNLDTFNCNPKKFLLTHRQKRIGFTLIYLNNINFTPKKSIRNFSTSSEPNPVLTYNPDMDKILVIKQNKRKSGIYRWVHKDSGKSYIGSKFISGARSFSTLNKEDSTNQLKESLVPVPVVVYLDAYLNKSMILNDNKNKPGIYRWVNKVNGKSYLGSSVNLNNRLKGYYRFNFICSNLAKGKSFIYSAILKYGYSNFQLEILEYCTAENVISREQYYIDLLKPEYNNLKTAGSRLGRKHTNESREKMSIKAQGRITTEETKKLLSLAKKGMNNPNFGKIHSKETRALITLAKIGKSFLSDAVKAKMSKESGTALRVVDLETNKL